MQQTAIAMNTTAQGQPEAGRLGLGSSSHWGGLARLVVKLGLAIVISLVLGGLTSPAQAWLPDAVNSFANSASGWTLLTALIVWTFRERAAPSAVFGAASFVALVLGYVIVSNLRGFGDTEGFFFVAAVAVGPFVGAAASWLHQHDFRAALGCGLLAGIGLGEAVFSLVSNEATTGWFYWTLISALSALLIAGMSTRRLSSGRNRALAIGSSIALAALFFAAYMTLA